MNASAPDSHRYREGLAVRRSVLGDAHVDRAEARVHRFRPAVPGADHRSRLGHGVVAAGLDQARALDGDAGAAGRARPRRGGGDACARHRQHRGHARGYLRGASCMWRSMPACRRPTRPSRSPSRSLRKWTPRQQVRCPLICSTAGPRPAPSSSATAHWHPPAFTPTYKTSVLRSPQKALLSLDNTISEITGPVFGHNMLGELDNDLIHNFAKPRRKRHRPAHHRLWPRARRARQGRCRARCSNSGRPMPAAATATRRRAIIAAARPEFRRLRPHHHRRGRQLLPSAPSSPGPIPGPTASTTGGPAHIHFSVFGHGFAQRLITQMYFEGDPLIWQCPIVKTIADQAADRTADRARSTCKATIPMDARAYKFDIVLRGRRSSLFENRLEGN